MRELSTWMISRAMNLSLNGHQKVKQTCKSHPLYLQPQNRHQKVKQTCKSQPFFLQPQRRKRSH